ncbi:Fatty acyl-CoA reductase 1 [Euphorbia peplus]|nr:Fatty acyl-CoA reductase 1 [Euphorbia peplus]
MSILTTRDNGIGVVEFLRGKCFFITGSTGFLAKVFIEKILRTVPSVGKIFLMIKGKSKEDILLRLKKEIIEDELFKIVRDIHGKYYQEFMMNKLVPLIGNISEDNLGMDTASSILISNQVHIIVSSAASTTFDERYDIAWNTNVKGPLQLLQLAKKCKKLQLFMHVSTAYVNGERKGIALEEPFSFEARINEENIGFDVATEMTLISDMKEFLQGDNELPQKMKDLGMDRAIIYGRQNTYILTKAICEMEMNKERGNVPIVIIRPTIIVSTFKDPFPGWIQGNRTIDPFFISYTKGLLPGVAGNPATIMDLVPVDMVGNAMIVGIAKHGRIEGKEAGMNVYHVSSSVSNPISLGALFKFVHDYCTALPQSLQTGLQEFKFFNSTDVFSSHIRIETAKQIGLMKPHFGDSKLLLQKQLEYMKRIKRFVYMNNSHQPFVLYQGRFDDSNTKKLLEQMSIEEKNIFVYDIKVINWKSYIQNVHLPGLRRCVIKEQCASVAPKL